MNLLTVFLALCLLSNYSIAGEKYDRETEEVKSIFINSDVSDRLSYCIPGKLVCQSLVLYYETLSFSFNFINVNSQLGASEYFIAKDNGRFKNYLDDSFDGEIKIDSVFPENKDIEVTFKDGLPSVENFKIVKHGTSYYAIAKFTFSVQEAVLTGVEYNSSDPTYRKHLNIKYERMDSEVKKADFQPSYSSTKHPCEKENRSDYDGSVFDDSPNSPVYYDDRSTNTHCQNKNTGSTGNSDYDDPGFGDSPKSPDPYDDNSTEY